LLFVPGMQVRQQQLNKIQQQVLEPATASSEAVVKRMQDLADMFHAAEPSMRWLREQKKRLEPKLGERWAEGLYPPDQTEEPAEVNHHRQVWLRVDCHKLVERTQQQMVLA